MFYLFDMLNKLNKYVRNLIQILKKYGLLGIAYNLKDYCAGDRTFRSNI